MKRCLSLLLVLLVWGCKEKKIDLSGEAPVKVSDFVAVFPRVSLPYTTSDTSLAKTGDTLTIGYKALEQFFPHSALTPLIGKDKKARIHPVGFIEKEKENYLLVKFVGRQQKISLVVFVTDKKNRYLASKELLQSGQGDGYLHLLNINREPTFLISREKMGKDNNSLFTRAGWVYAGTGSFMVVINDTNEDPGRSAVINPIDTLPRKNKYSGDYVHDKKNYIAIRDSKKAGVYQFFIHFEKNEGSCTGELKGEFKMTDASNAIFRENGDPCVIDFHFDGNEISLKEQGSCGNHRGIKCFFNDSFTRKREPKTRKK